MPLQRLLALVGGASIALCALTACSGSAPEPKTPREIVLEAARQARDAGLDPQYQAMKDGEVSQGEYLNAYQRLADCYKSGGLGIDPPVVNPADGISYMFELKANGLATKEVERVQQGCLAQEWLPISSVYVSTTPQRMDEPLRVATIECLREQGFELKGDELTLGEMAGDPLLDNGKQQSATSECVIDLAHQLYPDLTGINLIFV